MSVSAEPVNGASVNAFALPGGFIFVTRGLLTYINDEAELATAKAKDQVAVAMYMT